MTNNLKKTPVRRLNLKFARRGSDPGPSTSTSHMSTISPAPLSARNVRNDFNNPQNSEILKSTVYTHNFYSGKFTSSSGKLHILKCQFQFTIRSPEAHSSWITIAGHVFETLGHYVPDSVFEEAGIKEKIRQPMRDFISQSYQKWCYGS